MPSAPDRHPIGILGGTFDPVHYGHLRLAEEARAALGLATVRWIPAGRPPHRRQPHAAALHRLEMVRLAIRANTAFALDEAEVDSPQPSYTVETLARLRCELGPRQPLVLLLGVDAFLGLSTWHRWQELFALAHVALANRPGFPLATRRLPDALAAELAARRSAEPESLRRAAAGFIVPFEMTPLAISATEIRLRLGAGRSVRYLLPDPVLDYIGRNHLYSAPTHGR